MGIRGSKMTEGIPGQFALISDEQFNDLYMWINRTLRKDRPSREFTLARTNTPFQGISAVLTNGRATRTIDISRFDIASPDNAQRIGAYSDLFRAINLELTAMENGVGRGIPDWLASLKWMNAKPEQFLYKALSPSGIWIGRMPDGQYQCMESTAESAWSAAFSAIGRLHEDFDAGMVNLTHYPRYTPEVGEAVRRYRDNLIDLEKLYSVAVANRQ